METFDVGDFSAERGTAVVEDDRLEAIVEYAVLVTENPNAVTGEDAEYRPFGKPRGDQGGSFGSVL